MITQFIDNIPEYILNDKNVLYHGTSNIAEVFIDNNTSNNLLEFSLKACNEIIQIYQEINWDGLPGGYGVLSTFSKNDFRNENKKFMFLALTADRAARFATKDFAAGELARSVFYSILHLKNYLQKEELRSEHKADMERNFIYYQKNYDVDLNLLSNKVNNLDPIFKMVTELRNKYQYGVIYCYKIQPNQYHKLENKNAMGIIIKDELDKSTLVAKIIIKNYDNLLIRDKSFINRALFWHDIFSNKQNKNTDSFRTDL